MGLETPVYITDLVTTNPVSTDAVSAGDDHIRNLKVALAGTFTGFTGAAMSATEAELNFNDGSTSGTSVASRTLVLGANKETDVLTLTTLTSTNVATPSNTDLVISPNGTGDVDFNACSIMIDTGEGIKDAGGANYIEFTEDTTPVNWLGIENADTTLSPIISSKGGDTNININMVPKGSGKVDIQGGFMTSETTTSSGAAAVAITGAIHEITTTAADALTLADGAEGQHLYIVCVDQSSGDATLTPSNFAQGSTITFGDDGDSCHLLFTAGKWYMVGNQGCAVA
jgi:hypothetical protein